MFLAVLMLALVAFQSASMAAIVEGSITSVDAAAKKLEINAASGASWIAFSATTKWPAGVTDPANLVGKKVKITTDDATSQATSVEEVAAAAAAYYKPFPSCPPNEPVAAAISFHRIFKHRFLAFLYFSNEPCLRF